MREINLYVYNDSEDPSWDMEVCGACGQKLAEIKGKLIRRVTNVGAPREVFKASTVYLSIKCRRCGVRNNIYVSSYEKPNHYAM